MPIKITKKRILISGGAGFIGSHLVDVLLRSKIYDIITIIDDLSSGLLNNLPLNNNIIQVITKPVQNTNLSELASKKYDYAIHLAASLGVDNIMKNTLECCHNNIDSTRAFLDLAMATDTNKILFSSSSEVYGNSLLPYKENSSFILKQSHYPRASYAASKILDEFLVSMTAQKYNKEYLILRFFNITGPRQRGMVLPRLIHQAINDDPLTIYDDGNSIRTFTSVYDCIKCLKLLLQCKLIYKCYNIGSNNILSINQLADKVIQLSNSASKKKYITNQAVYGSSYNETRIRIPDLTRLKQLIDINHFWTIDNIIKDMISKWDQPQKIKQ